MKKIDLSSDGLYNLWHHLKLNSYEISLARNFFIRCPIDLELCRAHNVSNGWNIEVEVDRIDERCLTRFALKMCVVEAIV